MGTIRAVSARLACTACLAVIWAASAVADPTIDILGQWAVDPTDCVNGRYVWHFMPQSAALLIDGVPQPRYHDARYTGTGDRVAVEFVNDRSQKIDFVIRFLSPTQLIFEKISLDDQQPPRPDLRWQRWSRCPLR